MSNDQKSTSSANEAVLASTFDEGYAIGINSDNRTSEVPTEHPWCKHITVQRRDPQGIDGNWCGTCGAHWFNALPSDPKSKARWHIPESVRAGVRAAAQRTNEAEPYNGDLDDPRLPCGANTCRAPQLGEELIRLREQRPDKVTPAPIPLTIERLGHIRGLGEEVITFKVGVVASQADRAWKAISALSTEQRVDYPLLGVAEPHASMTRMQLVDEIDRYAKNYNELERSRDACRRDYAVLFEVCEFIEPLLVRKDDEGKVHEGAGDSAILPYATRLRAVLLDSGPDSGAFERLREALRTIRAWDILNPQEGTPEPLGDGPWLRSIIDEALSTASDPRTANARVNTYEELYAKLGRLQGDVRGMRSVLRAKENEGNLACAVRASCLAYPTPATEREEEDEAMRPLAVFILDFVHDRNKAELAPAIDRMRPEDRDLMARELCRILRLAGGPRTGSLKNGLTQRRSRLRLPGAKSRLWSFAKRCSSQNR